MNQIRQATVHRIMSEELDIKYMTNHKHHDSMAEQLKRAKVRMTEIGFNRIVHPGLKFLIAAHYPQHRKYIVDMAIEFTLITLINLYGDVERPDFLLNEELESILSTMGS